LIFSTDYGKYQSVDLMLLDAIMVELHILDGYDRVTQHELLCKAIQQVMMRESHSKSNETDATKNTTKSVDFIDKNGIKSRTIFTLIMIPPNWKSLSDLRYNSFCDVPKTDSVWYEIINEVFEFIKEQELENSLTRIMLSCIEKIYFERVIGILLCDILTQQFTRTTTTTTIANLTLPFSFYAKF
jgi:hypothetical protein